MPSPTRKSATLAPLVRHAAIAAMAVAVALTIVAQGLSQILGLSAAFPVKTMLVFLLAALWLSTYLPGHLPHVRLGPANLVTLSRLGLAALLGGFVGESQANIAWPAVGIAALALALDGVDGWLARRGGWDSAFGARFDMETDALLLLLMTCLIWQLGKAGPWVLLSGALRYLFLLAVVVSPTFRRPLPPSQRRKTICVLQILSLLVALLPIVPTPWSGGAAAAGLALLCYSFGTDSAWLLRQSRHHRTESLIDETR